VIAADLLANDSSAASLQGSINRRKATNSGEGVASLESISAENDMNLDYGAGWVKYEERRNQSFSMK